MKSLGLALGGGGLKGLAHIGVLQVLNENNIRPAFISGTSAGSIIAALYVSGVSPYKMEELVHSAAIKDYLDYNFCGIIKYLLHMVMPSFDYSLDGILRGKKIEKLIYELTQGKRLKDARLPVAIIACDIDSGRKAIFTNQNLTHPDSEIVFQEALFSEAVRCSISIPVTFCPRQFQGRHMVDGGLRDIVPVMEIKYMGADYILGISLGQEFYQTKVAGIPQIISRTISIMTYETSATEAELFANMLLHPEVADVGWTDFKDAAAIIRAGRRVMQKNIDKLKLELGK